jgi:membrane-bound lytic murein transglycosylase A
LGLGRHRQRLIGFLTIGRPRFALLAGAILGLALVLALVALYLLRPPPPPRLTLTPGRFEDLPGWRDDHVAAAIPPFLRSCAHHLGKADDAPLDPGPGKPGLGRPDFGRIGDWRPVCDAAAKLPPGDDEAARRFLEAAFVSELAGNNGTADGLFTGYFEITLKGSRQRGGAFQTPLYHRPPNADRFTRAEIEDGALAGQGLELVWVDSPIDAFFLEIQGSGQVRLDKGGTIRVGYDGGNGHAYVPVGRLLIERGLIPRERMSMAAIRDWMQAHPQEGAALRRENTSYVFFREINGLGPIGAEQVVLTPRRSLAVDRAFVALGVPIWLDAQERFAPAQHRGLVIAQDTGGAIKGPVRGDLFWGAGKEAATGAGAMNARGRYWLLLPKSVADRLDRAVAAH